MLAVFDTNIVIDALNGVTDADVEYSRYERVLISRITWIEVMVGAREDEAQVRNLLETHFEAIPLDYEDHGFVLDPDHTGGADVGGHSARQHSTLATRARSKR